MRTTYGGSRRPWRSTCAATQRWQARIFSSAMGADPAQQRNVGQVGAHNGLQSFPEWLRRQVRAGRPAGRLPDPKRHLDVHQGRRPHCHGLSGGAAGTMRAHRDAHARRTSSRAIAHKAADQGIANTRCQQLSRCGSAQLKLPEAPIYVGKNRMDVLVQVTSAATVRALQPDVALLVPRHPCVPPVPNDLQQSSYRDLHCLRVSVGYRPRCRRGA